MKKIRQIFDFFLPKKILNTFFPLALTLHKRRILFGCSKIIKTEALPWKNSEWSNHTDFIDMNQRSSAVLDASLQYIPKNYKVIDVCCNIGKLSSALVNSGYNKVYGFDVMISASLHRAQIFPNLKSENFKTLDFFEWSKLDEKFDAAVIVTAVLELIHPCINPFKVFKDKNIKIIVATICENKHTYPRYYSLIARLYGYKIIFRKKVDRDSNLYVFRNKL